MLCVGVEYDKKIKIKMNGDVAISLLRHLTYDDK